MNSDKVNWLRISLLFSIAMVSACMHSSLDNQIEESYKKANIAIQKSDWKTAYEEYEKSLARAEAIEARPEIIAVLYYEYGRTAGVLCKYDESEIYLNKALELDRKHGGAVQMTLNELALLNLQQKKYVKSVEHFEQSIPYMDYRNYESHSPTNYSRVLHYYRISLSGIGNAEDANKIIERIELIKRNNPEMVMDLKITPYGTLCE